MRMLDLDSMLIGDICELSYILILTGISRASELAKEKGSMTHFPQMQMFDMANLCGGVMRLRS
jgi:hypothetical protein